MIFDSNGNRMNTIGQFNINNNMMNRILREAEEKDEDEDNFDINADQFNEDDTEVADEDAKSKAVDDVMSDDEPDTEENDTDARSQAVADALSDDDTGSGEETGTENSDSEGEEPNDSGDESSDGGDEDFSIDGMDDEGNSESGEADSEGTEEGGDEDFSIDADGSNGEETSDNEGDDSGSEGDSDTGEDSNINDDLINKEKELLAGLSDKQIEIKTNELKDSFDNLMDTINQTSTKLSNISADQKTMDIVKYLITQLDKLSDMVNDYMAATFATKTYIENTIYYQTCLSQLNVIKKMLEDIASKDENKGNQKGKK